MISDEDRDELGSWVRSRTIDHRYAQRARIVLLAADGESNRAIGDTVGMHYNQVAVWRGRFGEFGVEGLFDEERPGRPPVYTHDDVIRLVSFLTELPPEGATRWTMEALAQRMHEHDCAISASQVWRICQALDLKPWQTQSWMTSHDPDFWEKAGDVCGLYLNPPENAVVWSVDEKSQIQAKSRVNPTKPAKPGTPTRRDYGYVRHGTVVLFAALDVHEGDVAGWVTDSTRSENFVEFLDDLVAHTSTGSSCVGQHPDHLGAHTTSGGSSTHMAPIRAASKPRSTDLRCASACVAGRACVWVLSARDVCCSRSSRVAGARFVGLEPRSGMAAPRVAGSLGSRGGLRRAVGARVAVRAR